MEISICIPTFNQSNYLEKAVRSAVNQSLRPSEIIVSDDCSTDDTLEVLERLSKEIPELRVVSQSVNLGISANTDACLRMATGEYVVRLDSDDHLADTYCEKLANLLVEHPDAGYAHAAVQEIDQHDKFLNQRWLARKNVYQSSVDALRAAIKGYRVAANIIMFRRTALGTVNYNYGRPNYVEDFHLSASLAASGFGNIYLGEKLSFYRVWIDTGKTRQKRKLMEIVGVTKVFKNVLEPAFRIRSWSLTKLNRNRNRFACANSDCLSWTVYSEKEKQELKKALLILSSLPNVKFLIWINMNGYGTIINWYNHSKSTIKLLIKKLFFGPKIYRLN